MAVTRNIRTHPEATASNPGVLGSFLKRDILSIPFLLSSFFMFLALFYSKDISSPGISMIGLFIFPISWNNAMGLVALAAGICSASNFAQERTVKFSRYILLRITRRQYLVTRFVSICVSTGCASFLAFFVFAIFCYFESSGILLPGDYSQIEVQTMSSLLFGNFPILWFLPIFATEFMFGAVIGGLGICATAFVSNRFIGYSSPFIILFIWNQIASWVGLPTWLNPLGLSKYTFEMGDVAATVAIYVATYAGLVLLLFMVFYFKGTKEVKNDN